MTVSQRLAAWRTVSRQQWKLTTLQLLSENTVMLTFAFQTTTDGAVSQAEQPMNAQHRVTCLTLCDLLT